MIQKSKSLPLFQRFNFAAAIVILAALTVFVYAILIQKPISYEPSRAANFPGDCDGNGAVTLIDFQILSNSFGKSQGQSGYDGRCDFNGNQTIDLPDFQVLSNNFGKTGTVTNTPTPRITATPTPKVTQGPTPTLSPGVSCSSLSGIERRFPCSPLVAGPMPEQPTSGTDAWDMFTSSLYAGASNSVNERFSAVTNPVGSGVVIRN